MMESELFYVVEEHDSSKQNRHELEIREIAQDCELRRLTDQVASMNEKMTEMATRLERWERTHGELLGMLQKQMWQKQNVDYRQQNLNIRTHQPANFYPAQSRPKGLASLLL